jgi:hypothetical protein
VASRGWCRGLATWCGPGGMARPWLAQAGGACSDAGACCGRGARAGAGEWVAEPRWHCRACARKALAQLPGSAPEPGSAPGAAASARARRRARSAQAARASSSRRPPRPAAVSGHGRTMYRITCRSRTRMHARSQVLSTGAAARRRWPGADAGLCLGRAARRTPGRTLEWHADQVGSHRQADRYSTRAVFLAAPSSSSRPPRPGRSLPVALHAIGYADPGPGAHSAWIGRLLRKAE